MLNREIGVILNGKKEILSVELQTDNPRFYFLRYFSCIRSNKFYNFILTQNEHIGYYKCFMCGREHALRPMQDIFSKIFNQIYNIMYYEASDVGLRITLDFVKEAVKSLRSGEFLIV